MEREVVLNGSVGRARMEVEMVRKKSAVTAVLVGRYIVGLNWFFEVGLLCLEGSSKDMEIPGPPKVVRRDNA